MLKRLLVTTGDEGDEGSQARVYLVLVPYIYDSRFGSLMRNSFSFVSRCAKFVRSVRVWFVDAIDFPQSCISQNISRDCDEYARLSCSLSVIFFHIHTRASMSLAFRASLEIALNRGSAAPSGSSLSWAWLRRGTSFDWATGSQSASF